MRHGAPQWIPAEERAPENQGEYLVHIKWAETATTLYYRGTRMNGEQVWRDADGEDYTVVHWMELPEVPKEG